MDKPLENNLLNDIGRDRDRCCARRRRAIGDIRHSMLAADLFGGLALNRRRARSMH